MEWPAPSRRAFPSCALKPPASEKQARIDRGQDRIIGVNLFPVDEEVTLEVLEIDQKTVRAGQVDRLEEVRAQRDDAAVESALLALTNGAKGDANLLDLAVQAARKRATLAKSVTRWKRLLVGTNRPFAK